MKKGGIITFLEAFFGVKVNKIEIREAETVAEEGFGGVERERFGVKRKTFGGEVLEVGDRLFKEDRDGFDVVSKDRKFGGREGKGFFGVIFYIGVGGAELFSEGDGEVGESGSVGKFPGNKKFGEENDDRTTLFGLVKIDATEIVLGEVKVAEGVFGVFPERLPRNKDFGENLESFGTLDFFDGAGVGGVVFIFSF